MKKQPKTDAKTLGKAQSTWDSFVKASTIATVAVIVILGLMALFLV